MGNNLQVLKEKIREGDEQALKVLYEISNSKLLQLAISITGSQEYAEDVIQDVFVDLWLKRKKLLTIDNLPGYIYKSTRNKSIQYLRKKNRRIAILREAGVSLYQPATAASPEELLFAKEIGTHIENAVQALPPRCRLIFSKVKVDGLKHREAASQLNLSIKTIENQLNISLKKLHKALKRNRAAYVKVG